MSKLKKQKKKKRDLDKYPALNPRLNAKTRFEVLDMDYLRKLNDAELNFMNQFMAEYVSGSFKKTESGNYSEENLHKTAEERRECYTRNNMRNRCGLTVSNATGQTYRCEDIAEFIDSLSTLDEKYLSNDINTISNFIYDDYDGEYGLLENEIMEEMKRDYMICLNPVTIADKKLAESNYGKKLKSIFNNSNFKKED